MGYDLAIKSKLSSLEKTLINSNTDCEMKEASGKGGYYISPAM